MDPALSGPPPLLVGNDVIDLSHPRCRGKTADERFLTRIFTPAERRRILASPDPDRALWRAWGAKESAFKVVSKGLGTPPPFTHAHFAVEADGPAGGFVTWKDQRILFREQESRSGLLHVLAWSPDEASRLVARAEPVPQGPPPLRRLGPRERGAVHSSASGWVRLRARSALADLLEVPETDLEIVCGAGPPGRTAPRLLVGGGPGSWDVSLSHHGRFLAWAARGPLPDQDGR